MKHLFFLCYYYYYYYLLLFRKQLYIFFAKSLSYSFPLKRENAYERKESSKVYLNLHLNINWQINFLYYPIKVEQLIFSSISSSDFLRQWRHVAQCCTHRTIHNPKSNNNFMFCSSKSIYSLRLCVSTTTTTWASDWNENQRRLICGYVQDTSFQHNRRSECTQNFMIQLLYLLWQK